jgi:hypothetical protein
MKPSIWILFAVVLIACSAHQAASLDCSRLQLDGITATFNLTVLAQYPSDFEAGDWNGYYHYRVCSNLQCGVSVPASACQNYDNQIFPVGRWDPGTTTAFWEGSGIVFVNLPMPGLDGYKRASRIHVSCDPNASTPDHFSALGHHPGSSDIFFDFFLSHKSACPLQ